MHKNRKRDALNMNLWVMSQNKKELRPNPKLGIDKLEDKFYIVDRYDFERATILGVYKTEQRALEVLDEIQSFLENNYISIDDMPSHSNSPYPGYYPTHISTMYRKKVFKMPKE